MESLEELVQKLENRGVLKTSSIKEALLKVDRINFIIPEYKEYVYQDRPLPLKEGQTISQPLTVIFMLELLQPKNGHHVLDVGSGSGWTTALLSELVGEDGNVYAIERINSLKKFGEENLSKLGYENVLFMEGNGAKGWPENAPFDRILVNASAKTIPPALTEQLKTGGKMVIPLDNAYGHLKLLNKITSRSYEEEVYPGFAFVPFINE
ncbi:MAG: hypothetical protein APF76_06650 [Desulfitibacter sp. BRH_c19]|nr:MAG: hypothetical protein APF76_06650 [Desulfitibacter sp. BRH_c19]